MAAVFLCPGTGSHTLWLLDDLPGLGWVISSFIDRLKGHSTSHASGAPDWKDEVPGLRAWLGSTVQTQDKCGCISDEVPVSQDVILGGKLGCHSETDDQLVLDRSWDEEESATFGYFP